MRIDLNLANNPFTNRRLFWVGIVFSLFLCSIFAIWISGERISLLSEISQLEQQKKAKELNIKSLRGKLEENQAEVPITVLTEDQKLQLASARLLISRGAFSWNGLMSDIEEFIPKDAFVTSMKIDEGGKVQESSGEIVAKAKVEIKVTGKTSAQMTEMMTALERSGGLFGVEQATQDPLTEDGNVPFTLKLIYKPHRTEAGGGE
jgi:hypothetical protein